MSIGSTIKMTARQFLELGEDPPGVRLELVDGKVAVSPSPIPRHGYVVATLTTLLVNHVKSHRLGRIYPDVDTIFGEHDVRRPDLMYFSKRRLHLIGEKAMEGPPDLCVEIISLSSTRVDRRDKFRQYENCRVKHYWIIDPMERTFEAYALTRGKYRKTAEGSGYQVVRAAPFADLEIPLRELWQPADGR